MRKALLALFAPALLALAGCCCPSPCDPCRPACGTPCCSPCSPCATPCCPRVDWSKVKPAEAAPTPAPAKAAAAEPAKGA